MGRVLVSESVKGERKVQNWRKGAESWATVLASQGALKVGWPSCCGERSQAFMLLHRPPLGVVTPGKQRVLGPGRSFQSRAAPGSWGISPSV